MKITTILFFCTICCLCLQTHIFSSKLKLLKELSKTSKQKLNGGQYSATPKSTTIITVPTKTTVRSQSTLRNNKQTPPPRMHKTSSFNKGNNGSPPSCITRFHNIISDLDFTQHYTIPYVYYNAPYAISKYFQQTFAAYTLQNYLSIAHSISSHHSFTLHHLKHTINFHQTPSALPPQTTTPSTSTLYSLAP